METLYKVEEIREYPDFDTGVVSLEALPLAEEEGWLHSGVSFRKDGERKIPVQRNKVFSGAQWVGFGDEMEAVVAQRDFYLTARELEGDFTLTVTALGFGDLYINGKKVSERLFSPAWTNYGGNDFSRLVYPISDTMTARILFERFSLKELLQEGKNSLVFHIGAGWYAQHECINEGVKPYGKLCLAFTLKRDGELFLSSDENVMYRRSYVLRSSIYYGEVQDARQGGYDFSLPFEIDGGFKHSHAIPAPKAVLSLGDCPEDRVCRTVRDIKCVHVFGDTRIYDLGENLAGYPVIRFGERDLSGVNCTVRYGEELNEDGSLNFRYTGGDFRVQRDVYFTDGTKKEFYPLFGWRAGRYFEVTGGGEPTEFRVVHTLLEQRQAFKSSDPTLQWIFDSFIRTQLNNVHCCVPSDCPHRERLGYTGDGQLCSRAVMTIFDARRLYEKWMRDVADCQDIYNGHVQHTAPFYGGGGGPGGWGGAIVFVPYNYYKIYGDISFAEKYYPNMLLYLDYMRTRSEGELVVREEKGGWCLGDWCAPGNINKLPEPFVNTYFRIKAIRQTVELGSALGYDTASLEREGEAVVKAFTAAYCNPKTGRFLDSTESADAYAYDLGLGDGRTLEAIVEKYSALGQFDTGIFGTDILIRVLCENGFTALARELLTSQKENTFFNMKRQGATTLWENWDGCDSRDHPMFGAITEYLVKHFNEIKH